MIQSCVLVGVTMQGMAHTSFMERELQEYAAQLAQYGFVVAVS